MVSGVPSLRSTWGPVLRCRASSLNAKPLHWSRPLVGHGSELGVALRRRSRTFGPVEQRIVIASRRWRPVDGCRGSDKVTRLNVRGLPTGYSGLFAGETGSGQTSGMVLGANARSTQLGGFVLLTRKEQVLLVKQSYGLGLWALPGGLTSPGETVEAAAMREANEETGLDVELGGIVGIADRGSVVLVVFAGSVRGGQLRAEPGEIEEVGWFGKEELLVMGDAFALARALASAALEGSIGRGLVAGSVAGPDGGGHSVFWSMSPVGQ